jgi:hypothetical protein
MAAEFYKIECCIDEWLTGVREDIKFASVTYSPVYVLHLKSLQRFEDWTAAYKLMGRITNNLLDVARLVLLAWITILLTIIDW